MNRRLGNLKHLSDKGFTLLEVLLVLALLLILIYQAAAHFSTSDALVRQKTDSANRLRIESAVELYKLDTGKVPQNIEDLISPSEKPKGWRGSYLEQVLENPIKGAGPYALDAQGKVIK
jgi:general secretion pathway protein G